MKGWMYILECADGSYYTGSTNNLELRLHQHQSGEGANHTKKWLPVKLVYYKEFEKYRMHFTGKSKYRAGEEKRKKHSLRKINICFLNYHLILKRKKWNWLNLEDAAGWAWKMQLVELVETSVNKKITFFIMSPRCCWSPVVMVQLIVLN